MASRLSLHSELVELLGSQYVYFQPPESIKLVYPCIVYKRSDVSIKYADDSTYNYTKAYEITVIDKDPDSILVDKMLQHFNKIKFARHFVSDNLNHDVFVVFY